MEKRNYSENIVHEIKSALMKNDWGFFFDEQRGVFTFDVGLKGKLKKINYIIEVNKNDYIVFAISPLGVDAEDEKMMASMAEFICRANYNLKTGSFDFDMRDGEIRFKCFVDCNGITLSSEIVKSSIHCPAAIFEHYGKGILEIIFNNATAEDAIAKSKKSPVEKFHERFVEEYINGNSAREIMFARLDKILGTEDSDSNDTGDSVESDGDGSETEMDLFEDESASR